MIGHTFRKQWEPVLRHKAIFLLVFLLAFILIFPFFEQIRIGDVLLVVIITGLLISAVFSVSENPREVAVTILLLIPTVLATWANFFRPFRTVFLLQIVSVVIFLVYTQAIILRRVMRMRDITENEIFSAVSVYIMLGLAYAFTYQFIELVTPGSFQFGSVGNSFSSLMFFSFETLATVGYGEIIVISPFARSVTILEMITGVMYLAIFIGVLVNAHYRFRDKALHDEADKGTVEKTPGIFRSGGPLSLIIIGVLVNLASAITISSLQIPLYFDTWGTSLAVIHSGFPAGAVAAVATNLTMAFAVRTPITAIWSVSGILIAAMTWGFLRKGWINLRHPARILAAGLLSGAASAILLIALAAAFNLPPYSGTLVVSRFVSHITGNTLLANLAEQFAVELVDKTLSLFLAAVIAFLVFGTAVAPQDTPEP